MTVSELSPLLGYSATTEINPPSTGPSSLDTRVEGARARSMTQPSSNGASAIDGSLLDFLSGGRPAPSPRSLPTASPSVELNSARRLATAGRLETDLRAWTGGIAHLIKTIGDLHGFPKIKVVPSSQLPTGAQYDTILHEISISEDEPYEKQIGLLLFEMLNTEKRVAFKIIEKRAALGSFTRKTYAKEMEKVEYENMKHHHELTQGTPFDIFKEVLLIYPTFEDYWRSGTCLAHAEQYMHDFDRLYAKKA